MKNKTMIGNEQKNVIYGWGLLCLSILLFFLFSLNVKAERANPYSIFSVPTQVSYLGDSFFLVDCYHDQILTSKEAGVSPSQWKVAMSGLSGPHAIAWDGEVYMVVDTENNRVVTYRKTWEGFEQLQEIKGVGNRPHYVSYDPTNGLFYVWSSLSGQMYTYKRAPGSQLVYQQDLFSVPQLAGFYVRSFYIEGDTVYLPCVDLSCIAAVDKSTFALKEGYPIAEEIAGGVQLLRIEDMFYLTVLTDRSYDQSKACFIRTPSLEALRPEIRGYEVLTSRLGGVPYYLTKVGNSWYGPIPRENGRSGIVRFDVFAHEILNVREYSW